MSVKNYLPEISVELQQHTNRVTQHIVAEINASGPIAFDRFMELALYASGLGYYVVGTQKFGRQGDFITAPEISALFSQCLARQCAQVLTEVPGDILEFGAGSGIMAADILLELEKLNCLPEHYLILELSPELQSRQHQLIQKKSPELLDKVRWLNQLPDKFTGVVLANEVLDAMPVNIFCVRENNIYEKCVDWRDNQFVWVEKKASSDIVSAVKKLNLTAENEYTSEINLAIPAWINSINDCLQQGAVILIDYGFPRREFYHEQRDQGTLMCHIAHHAHSDPLVLPGIQDITAHVDFTAVAEAATQASLELAGFTSQANFLINSGLLHLIAQDNDPETQIKLANQIKLLTLPSEMGELFKVIAFTKNFNQPMIGFQSGDMRHRL